MLNLKNRIMADESIIVHITWQREKWLDKFLALGIFKTIIQKKKMQFNIRLIRYFSNEAKSLVFWMILNFHCSFHWSI